MALSPGTRLGSYQIVSAIGAGGMGEVYRATDTKLGRDVALKILPESVAEDPDRLMRFEREARTLASLNHPGIVTVYSVEEHDGVHFLTMELVEGRDLDALRGSGRLPLPGLLDVAIQMSDALHAAHERGVVHRDLKPANVMVTGDGRVKVLDFGLAKQTEGAGATDETAMATEAGMVMGTAPYMSPEQLQGLPIDRRSDIFSLGIVLHELASGVRPFQGGNAAALSSAILRDDPPPVTSVDASLPEDLAKAILRCLKKECGARFQTTREVSETLKSLRASAAGAPSAPSTQKAVVVLPFVNRSPDAENEYFADGLTEEVIADLSRVSSLRVISRNSAMALKGTTKNTATLARELGVSHLVTGSVRRAGNALRVTAELVVARDDAPVWSDKFSGTMDDVFAIQEEIARKIVEALKVTLSDSESRRVAERPIADTAAYDCYLRARHEMYGWTPDAAARAHRLVDQALGIVGDVPMLVATKGLLHWNDVNVNRVPAGEGLAAAAACADRALVRDPDLPAAVFVRGLVAGLKGQPELALPDLYRAHALAPNDAGLLAEVCRFSNSAGLRHYGALVERIGQLDPLVPLTWLVFSTYHWVQGRPGQAAVHARRAVEMAAAPSMLDVLAAWQMAEAGAAADASATLRRAGEALAGTVLGSWASFQERALAGDAESAAALSAGLEGALRNEFAALLMAGGHALLGRTADAIRWARLAVQFGFVNYPYLSEHSRYLAPLRNEPEFQDLLRSVEPRRRGPVAWEAAQDER